jgi:hypothetical protein
MALAETRGALARRDPDAALNIVTDKIIMLNIGMNYARTSLLEMQWAKLLVNTSVGRRLLKIFPEMMENYNKAKKYLDLEILANKGKQLLE